MDPAPLPAVPASMSQAVQPSVFTVGSGASGPLLDHLCLRFPRIGREDWLARMEGGRVLDEAGRALPPGALCRPGQRVRYFREVPREPPLRETERILFRDPWFLVADKPAFMPLNPSGPYLKRSLVHRLREATGLPDLSPVHRLDRETTGLVLCAWTAEARTAFAQLFPEGRIRKTYHAVGRLQGPPGGDEWTVENRLVEGEPFFRMAVGEGPPNARTRVRLLAAAEDRGLFEVEPATGKKHQIRIHMAGLGFPILHDRLYPDLWPDPRPGQNPEDEGPPLQLQARELAFVHPFTGEPMVLRSDRTLAEAPARP